LEPIFSKKPIYSTTPKDAKKFIEQNIENQRKYADKRGWVFYQTFIEQLPVIGNAKE